MEEKARITSKALVILDFAIISFCLVFFLLGLFAINELSIYTPDSARYLIWSNSLAHVEGYIDRTTPDPERYVIHAPLYSLILAPVERFFPYSFIAAKVVTLCFALLMLFLFYRLLTKLANKSAAFIACLFLATNPFVFIYSTEILSDIPFIACMILFFLLLEKIIKEESREPKLFVALLVTIAIGILLREIGISLLLTSVAVFLMKKDYKRAIFVLILPLIPYIFWYYRNELIVAGIENPPLTNSKLFRSHYFSLPGEFFLTEYIARFKTNAIVYGEMVSSLMFYPAYLSQQALLVSKIDPAVAIMRSVVEYGKYLIGAFSVCCSLTGLYLDVRQSSTGKGRLWFLLFYIGIILLYPINDRRFLSPVLILLIYYFLKACIFSFDKFLSGKRFDFVKRLVIPICVVVLAVPNSVWTARYIANSYSYNKSPKDFYNTQHALADYPWHFTKLFRNVGDWIAADTDSSSVFLAQWKDLACWTHGRKLFPADQNISPDEFEHVIRDYGVRYVIAMVNKNEVREFEFQMHQSGSFAFQPVQRIGNAEIYAVVPKNTLAGKEGDETSFSRGLTSLNQQQYAEAEDIFRNILLPYPASITPQFFMAVSEEFAGNFQKADSLFTTFRSYGQAGMVIQEAAAHQRIIGILRDLNREENRSESLFRVAAGYWGLGFRSQARLMIAQSVMADSTFAPSQIFGLHFALKEKDTSTAIKYYHLFKASNNLHPLFPAVSSLFSHLDSLSNAVHVTDRASLLLKIANDYNLMGLKDEAIDNLLLSLEEKPLQADVLSMLGDLYLSKRRLAPARKAFEEIIAVDPQNSHAISQLSQIIQRF